MESIINFENLESIGIGGHGEVFKIKNADIVIKKSKNENLTKEGEILQSLQNVKYFPKLYMFNRDLIIMEYVEGVSLSTWLMRGNIVTDNIIKQVNEAFKLCLLEGVYPVELEPDHIILNGNTIRIIDLGMYQRIRKVHEPSLIKMELEKFTHNFFHWVDFYNTRELNEKKIKKI